MSLFKSVLCQFSVLLLFSCGTTYLLTGEIKNENEESISNALIIYEYEKSGKEDSTRSGRTGEYFIGNLKEDKIIISISALTYEKLTETIRFGKSNKKRENFILKKQKTKITGKVLDAASKLPISNAYIVFYGGNKQTDENGFFEIEEGENKWLYARPSTISAQHRDYKTGQTHIEIRENYNNNAGEILLTMLPQGGRSDNTGMGPQQTFSEDPSHSVSSIQRSNKLRQFLKETKLFNLEEFKNLFPGMTQETLDKQINLLIEDNRIKKVGSNYESLEYAPNF